MSWVGENGVQHNKESFNSFQARLLQHEYDHIEGVVCLGKALPGTIGFVNNDPLQEILRSD
ncbi:peptide deformylase [Candidatus Nomurabacteria bacterium]|nr:peptide deformylase [Candidatus Nomurabacteria bacterium]